MTVDLRVASTTNSDWLDGTTTYTDRTFLYSGSSSDQDPHLLRHLVYDEAGCFGDERWTVWRVGAQPDASSYLTVFPNHHMDCHVDMYSTDKIESLFAPHQDELVRLYYTFVHPSYPILQPMDVFLSQRASGRLPSSLLALVYLFGQYFWQMSPMAESGGLPEVQRIRPYIFSCLAFEARTPNLSVVQATLLYLQLPPRLVRAPNHPGFWAMTCMLVGVAQDIGLNVDPSSWNISSAERKMRRILWWAVFVQDKWMAHWLGRPSHILTNNWNVAPLSLDDFSDEQGRLPVQAFSWANAFIALTTLSLILSDVLDTFYSIRSNFVRMVIEQAIEVSHPLLDRLALWRQDHVLGTATSDQYTVQLAAFTLEISIYRAIFGSQNATGLIDESLFASKIMATVEGNILPLLASVKMSSMLGLWLSYTKGNLTMVGSSLITLVLASVDEEALENRQRFLLGFRDCLKDLAEQHRLGQGYFEFSRLPVRRLNLIIEELFGRQDAAAGQGKINGDPLSVTTSPASSDETEEMVWASYQIAFP